MNNPLSSAVWKREEETGWKKKCRSFFWYLPLAAVLVLFLWSSFIVCPVMNHSEVVLIVKTADKRSPHIS